MATSPSNASEGDITVFSSRYGDYITGTDGSSDLLVGGRGSDTLVGLGGDDTLDGGPGDDDLAGGPGRDTFMLGKDSGWDSRAVGYPEENDQPDRILLKPGISLDDVAVTRSSTSSAYVRILDTGARLAIWWTADISPDEVFLETADGQTMTYGEFSALPIQTSYWQGANPTPIKATGPNSLVTGTSGSDYLVSTYRGTTFDLGPGNDYIQGGNDSTLLFGKDSGQDLAYYSEVVSADDVLTVKFADDVTPDEVMLNTSRNGGTNINITQTAAQLSLGNSAFFWDTPAAPLLRLVFADGTVWGNQEVAARVVPLPYAGQWIGSHDGRTYLEGGDFDDQINGSHGNDTLIGGQGLDTLNGYGGNDLLLGGDQGDELKGDHGDDTLRGGSGYDMLDGGEGKDVYLFGRGDMVDQIINGDGLDVIRVDADLAPTDVHLITSAQNGSALQLAIKGTEDRIVFNAPVSAYSSKWGIEQIEFADGTIWSHQDLTAMLLRASDGDDAILGANMADLLDGQSGNDRLYGNRGDDTLEGSIGQDTLDGGEGNDTFRFRQGDGADIIEDAYWRYREGSPVPDPEFDVLELPDYLPEDIERISTRGQSGKDVHIAFKSGDSVTLTGQLPSRVTDWYTEIVTSGVSEVRFADGSRWDRAQLIANISPIGTNGADTMTGSADRANALQGLGGDDYLFGGQLADTLDGGTGIDYLWGMRGDDTYIVDGEFDPVRQTMVIDRVYEGAGTIGGIDQVHTNLSAYQLPDNVENLVMNGKGHATSAKPDLMAGKAGVRHGTGNALGNHLTGSMGHDVLAGLGGDDVLLGLFGNDTLDGGAGLDTLQGGIGDDTYILNDGSFTPDGQAHNVDTIIDIGQGTDTIETSIDHLRLPDLIENLLTSATHGSGNAQDNRLTGGAMGNVLMGLGGADTLDGGGGGDTLVGGQGDDLLISAAATSDDTFVWGKGEGADRLQDAGGVDTLQVLPGIQREQLWLSQVGLDLEISLIGTDDSFTVAQWYSPDSATHQLEWIELAGGQTLSGANLQQLVDAMAVFAPPSPGQTTLPPETSAALTAAIAANWT